MLHTKDHQSGLLFDPLAAFSPRRKRLLQSRWLTSFAVRFSFNGAQRHA